MKTVRLAATAGLLWLCGCVIQTGGGGGRCGDGVCGGDETCQSCAGDCGMCPAFCGSGVSAITPPEVLQSLGYSLAVGHRGGATMPSPATGVQSVGLGR